MNIRWLSFQGDESFLKNRCLDCGLISVDWAEKDDPTDTDDHDANNIYCPRCHSFLYFIATDAELKVAV